MRNGLKRYRGRDPIHLFSGLLKCTECGSNLGMADTRAYCCFGYINGRICSNDIRVRRQIVEARLLEGIKQDLLTDRAIGEFKCRVMKACKTPDTRQRRRDELQAEISRYLDAVAAGLMSATIKKRIEVAELALAEPAGDGEVIDAREILALLPSLIERYRGIVADLGSTAQTDPEWAQECIRSILGADQGEA